MKITPQSIKIKPARDTQKQRVYKLDYVFSSYINKKIKNNQQSADKLYGDLNDRKNIIKLTKKLFDDFGLGYCKVSIDEKIDHSYCQSNMIVFSSHDVKTNNIEIALHEFAHLILHEYFDYHTDGHGALFVTVLKMLFAKYELLAEEQFDYINKKYTNDKVKELINYILEIKEINENDISKIENSQDITSKKSGKNYKIYSLNDSLKNIKTRVIVDEISKKITQIKVNLFGYELGSDMFIHMTDDELLNFVLYSPAYRMDEYLNKSHAQYSNYGYSYIKIEKNQYLKITEEIEITHESKINTSNKIKRLINESKKNRVKYKRCISYNEYNELKLQLHKEIFKRNGNKNIVCL